jgi:aspartate ammonia-lyase
MSQSTNDFYPTALKVALLLYNEPLLQEVDRLARAFRAKGAEFADVIKMGRTETQDAVPMTLGQEFNAFAAALETEHAHVRQAETALYVINMGGTAIGTGLNAPKGYAEKCTAHLATLTGKKIVLAPDLIAATSDLHGFVVYSAALKSLAAKLVKISADLMFLSSGPRTGIAEITRCPDASRRRRCSRPVRLSFRSPLQELPRNRHRLEAGATGGLASSRSGSLAHPTRPAG